MHKKKLIEVAIPLDAINKEAAREKSIRHGHPSTLHLWWARRPLAACRAVLFASLVDDPSAHPDQFPTDDAQEAERDRLFRIIEDLVKWENSNNSEVLKAALAEILASCDGNPPPVLDPFAGGGSIPLEAQRLGLEAHASDLNPVAVLINKALIEIPPRFADRPPVRPEGGTLALGTWLGAQGLAEDVRYYGRWIRDEAQRRVGHVYPKIALPPEHGGGEATAIAWLWARTVQSPNPAWNGHVPLVRSFALSSRKGRESWVEPVVERDTHTVRFKIRSGSGQVPEGTVGRNGGRCLATGAPIPLEYIRAEGKAGRLGQQLIAVVAEGARGRIYAPASAEQEEAALTSRPEGLSDAQIPHNPRYLTTPNYGMSHYVDLFTDRQLTTLAAFSDLIGEVREVVQHDAILAGLPDDRIPLRDGGIGATAYAESVSVYLAFALDKMVDRNSALCAWETVKTRLRGTFQRQALPMTWDFAEANPFGDAGGDYSMSVFSVWEVLQKLVGKMAPAVAQQDAALLAKTEMMVSTDPPYYDNVPYADLSDFFYIWLRRSLASVYPDECSTLLVPKTQELVADQYRHGGKQESERHFEHGMAAMFKRVYQAQHPKFPLTIYYAFKQAETNDGATASTGWETMLQSLLDAEFTIEGTWPMRSELANRMRGQASNALATSIVLVCRQRPESAPLATRNEFIATLKAELPSAVRTLQRGNIAPVDMAQAAIGPGMAVFSRYSSVLEADGRAMRVRTALELINQVLDETIAGTDADFDSDTRWAVTWFEDCGMNEGDFGRAEQLSKSRNTSGGCPVDRGTWG